MILLGVSIDYSIPIQYHKACNQQTTSAKKEDPSPTVDKPVFHHLQLKITPPSLIMLRHWSKTLLWQVNLTPTMRDTRLSIGQLGDIILDLNTILHNEFYPLSEMKKPAILMPFGGPSTALLSAAAISIAAHAKTMQE